MHEKEKCGNGCPTEAEWLFQRKSKTQNMGAKGMVNNCFSQEDTSKRIKIS